MPKYDDYDLDQAFDMLKERMRAVARDTAWMEEGHHYGTTDQTIEQLAGFVRQVAEALIFLEPSLWKVLEETADYDEVKSNVGFLLEGAWQAQKEAPGQMVEGAKS